MLTGWSYQSIDRSMSKFRLTHLGIIDRTAARSHCRQSQPTSRPTDRPADRPNWPTDVPTGRSIRSDHIWSIEGSIDLFVYLSIRFSHVSATSSTLRLFCTVCIHTARSGTARSRTESFRMWYFNTKRSGWKERKKERKGALKNVWCENAKFWKHKVRKIYWAATHSAETWRRRRSVDGMINCLNE